MKKSMLKHTCLIGVMAVSIFLSCDSSEYEVVVPEEWMVDSTWVATRIELDSQYDASITLEEIMTHRDNWLLTQMDRYRYVVRDWSYWGYGLMIEYTVDNLAGEYHGEVLEGYIPSQNDSPSRKDSVRLMQKFLIEALFKKSIGYFNFPHDRFEGAFHKEFHFPVTYYLDRYEDAADDEAIVEITDFWVLEEAQD